MLQSRLLLNKLFSLIAEITTSNSNLAYSKILSITLAIPELQKLRLPSAWIDEYRYYANLESHQILLGLGTAYSFKTIGINRIAQLQSIVSDLKTHWIYLDADNTGYKPSVFLTLAFDSEDSMTGIWKEIPNTLLEIPAVLFHQTATNTTITCSCKLVYGQPEILSFAKWSNIIENFFNNDNIDSTLNCSSNTLTRVAEYPEQKLWLTLATQAKNDIFSHNLDKVVLARHIHVQGQRNFNPVSVSTLLTERYPTCTQIALSLGNRTLVAASPEKLATIQSSKIICEAVAGTVPNISQAELIRSPKMRHEHALVINHLVEKLQALSSELHIPKQPEIFSLRFVHHLRSKLTAVLKENCTIFDLLQHLHPTPAVGGTPTINALNWLKRYEPIQRGWYAGIMGWLDVSGNGELSLILRCALLQNNQADLFAGAGIVADSNPEAELAETEIKFQTLLDVLQNV